MTHYESTFVGDALVVVWNSPPTDFLLEEALKPGMNRIARNLVTPLFVVDACQLPIDKTVTRKAFAMIRSCAKQLRVVTYVSCNKNKINRAEISIIVLAVGLYHDICIKMFSLHELSKAAKWFEQKYLDLNIKECSYIAEQIERFVRNNLFRSNA